METFDQVLAKKIGSWYVGEWPVGNLLLCVIALFLSVLLCGAVGLERERRGRNAGLRTHLLVGVGSCMLMIISIYGFPLIKTGEDVLGNPIYLYNRDVARLAAQVVAGIGFLGAGAIIHRNSGARGLTTAATIWIVMCIGLACGSMNFILAIGGTLVILLFLTFFKTMEMKITNAAPRVYIRTNSDTPIVGKILDVARKWDYHLSDMRTELDDDTGLIEISFIVNMGSKNITPPELIIHFESIEGVKDVRVTGMSKLKN